MSILALYYGVSVPQSTLEQIYVCNYTRVANPSRFDAFARGASCRAGADVLNTLFPSLTANSCHSSRPIVLLNKIDHFMSEECLVLLDKLSHYILGHEYLNQDIIRMAFINRAFSVTSQFSGSQHWLLKVNQDSWIQGAMQWLQPNLEALSESQQLLEYSHSYAKDTHQANSRYRHLLKQSSQLDTQIELIFNKQQLQLTYFIDSPLCRYQVATLSRSLV
jgi:hypothetical protein